MIAKDLKFKNRFCFNVKINGGSVNLKVNELYEYQIRDGWLMIGNQNGFVSAEVIGAYAQETLSKLAEFENRNVMRLDAINQDTYIFSLFGFYERVNYDGENSLEIVIDQAIESRLRAEKINLKDAVKFFSDEIILNNNICFGYGDSRKDGILNLIGKKYNIQVKESVQGYLHIIDFNRIGNIEASIVNLIIGGIKFISPDEITKTLTAAFKEKYNALIHDNSELIKLWDLYDTLDLESIKASAKNIGYLKYKNYKKQNDFGVFEIMGNVSEDFLDPSICYVALSDDVFNKLDPMEYDSGQAVILGTEYDFNCKNTRQFIISLEQVDIWKKIPKQGYIVPSITGSIVQSRRRKKAQNLILSGRCNMPGMSLLLQSGETVGIEEKHRNPISDKLQKKIFGTKGYSFNDKQKEAIDIAVNTPDIAIIQGPPGTGKTTVIRGIIERINELENGQARILVASTQHEAVDNVAKEVSYNGIPANRVYSRRQKQYDDSPIYSWIDLMREKCNDWLESHPKQSRFSNLYRIMYTLQNTVNIDKQEELESLRKELLKLNFSRSILDRMDECVLEFIESKNILLDDENQKRLQNQLLKQRTQQAAFLDDGAQNISELIKYLQYERFDIEFEIPDYWRKLKRTTQEVEELKEWLEAFSADIQNLKEQYCSKQISSEDINFKINDLIHQIKDEMQSMDAPKDELLHEFIWKFSHELSNPNSVKNIISSYSQLNAATCQQTANSKLNPGMKGFEDNYDYVIVDEAARSNPLDLLIPMSLGRKIILVGDSRQLPHLVNRDIIQKVEEKMGDKACGKILEESLFLRLYNLVKVYDSKKTTKRTCALAEQRRMHPDICDVVNQFYTDSPLISMCSKEEKAHDMGLYNNKALCWIDIPNSNETQEQGTLSKYRKCEIDVLCDELSAILQKNQKFNVGVISFYSAQVNQLQKEVEKRFPGDVNRIRVGTVDAFQGNEFDIVLLSTVRSNTKADLKSSVGFLDDDRRLCVAFSRAKRLLVTVGDSHTVACDKNGNERIKALSELLKVCRDAERGYYEYKNI